MEVVTRGAEPIPPPARPVDDEAGAWWRRARHGLSVLLCMGETLAGLVLVLLGVVTAGWLPPELASGTWLVGSVAAAAIAGGVLLLAGALPLVRSGWEGGARLHACLVGGLSVLALPGLALLAGETWAQVAEGRAVRLPTAWTVVGVLLPGALGLVHVAAWRRAQSRPADATRLRRPALRTAAVVVLLLGVSATWLRQPTDEGYRTAAVWLANPYAPDLRNWTVPERMESCRRILQAEWAPACRVGRAGAQAFEPACERTPWRLQLRERLTTDALAVLAALGPEAAPAVPELLGVLAGPPIAASSAGVELDYAIRCAEAIGPAARACVPGLLGCLHARAGEHQEAALWAAFAVLRPPTEWLDSASAALVLECAWPRAAPAGDGRAVDGAGWRPPLTTPAAHAVLAAGAPTAAQRLASVRELVRAAGQGGPEVAWTISHILPRLDTGARGWVLDECLPELASWADSPVPLETDAPWPNPADGRATVLWHLVSDLGRLDPRFVALQARALRSPRAVVRRFAIHAVRQLGSDSPAIRDALQAIADAAAPGDEAARAQAALAALGGGAPADGLASAPTGTGR